VSYGSPHREFPKRAAGYSRDRVIVRTRRTFAYNKSSRRAATIVVVIFQQRRHLLKEHPDFHCRSCRISTVHAYHPLLCSLPGFLPPTLCLSLSLSLFLSLFLFLPVAVRSAPPREFRDQTKRKRSDPPVSGVRLCMLARYAHMCARPVTRINPVHPHVKCTVKRKWPLRTGEPSVPSLPLPSRADPPSSPPRVTSFPLSSAI